MRKTIWTLSFTVFVISAAWAIHSGMDYEPTIAFVSSIITMITLYFTSEKVDKKENKIVIKGKKNKVKQINFERVQFRFVPKKIFEKQKEVVGVLVSLRC